MVPVSNKVWAVTGTLTLVKRKDGTYGVFNDIYDFDIKPISGSDSFGSIIKKSIRNTQTYAGRPSCDKHSGCTGYSIEFKGNINPNNIIGLPK